MNKRLRKPDRDDWGPLLLVARTADIARWKLAAQRSGMSVIEWCRDRLNRIAPERVRS